MGLNSYIKDGTGKGHRAMVTEENALIVVDSKLPVQSESSKIKPFSQYFTDDGLPSDGVNFDMQIDATAEPSGYKDFYIPASSEADRYIDSISYVVADAGSVLNKWGNTPSKNIGFELFYEDSVNGDVVIFKSIKSNFELIRSCGKGTAGIGSGTNAFRANNVQGASEGYIPVLDFTDQFGLP